MRGSWEVGRPGRRGGGGGAGGGGAGGRRVRWRHRATFLADWDDLVGAGPDAFTVRPDCVGRPITPDPVGGSCTGVAVLDEIALPAREPHADARAPRTKQRTAPLRGVGGRRQTAPDIYVIVSGFGHSVKQPSGIGTCSPIRTCGSAWDGAATPTPSRTCWPIRSGSAGSAPYGPSPGSFRTTA